MKRVKIAVAILILLPLLIFCVHLYLKQATEKMSDALVEAQTALLEGDKENAALQVAAFQKSWNSNKMVLGTFIRHAELDIINLSSVKLMPYLTNDENAEFFAEAESLKTQLKHLWESEKFNIDNIF